MDTGGFAMYIETVLSPWWMKEQTSWTGPDPFPAKRMLLVWMWLVREVGKTLKEEPVMRRLGRTQGRKDKGRS